MADRPTMHDPQDKDVHDGKDEPLANRAKVVSNGEDDEKTSTPDNSFERGLEQDGEYRDAVDAMRKTLKNDGSRQAWKTGRTQN